MLFPRAWVKVMSLIKEIDEILTCSNIDHGGYNGYDDDLKKLSRFDDDVCDERCMLCKGSGQDQGIWDCQKIDLLAVYSCIDKSQEVVMKISASFQVIGFWIHIRQTAIVLMVVEI